jgi:phenylacetate-CoA ligase
MTLRCALHPGAAIGDGFAAQIVEALRDQTRLRGEVEIVDGSTLPEDGKLIEDARSYD